MNRRHLLKSGALAATWAVAAPAIGQGRVAVADLVAAPPSGRVEISIRAADLVLGCPVIDMLGLLTLDWTTLWRWQRDPIEFSEVEFRRLEGSGVNIFHPAVKTGNPDPYATARRWLINWNRLVGGRPCFLERIDSSRGLRLTPRVGRTGVIVGFQDSDHFRTPADVSRFFALGQRVSQLTYNESNRIGSGCYARADRGLTAFGIEIVGAMNGVGMAVDVSHCGERTTLEAIDASRAPVLVTHANCRALAPTQPRCKSDAVIRRLASRGGVIGITVVRPFVGTRDPSLADLLEHFDHVARVAGPEHVGLGSDADVTTIDPRTGRINPLYDIGGLVPAARVYQIADGLLQRGWLARDVEGVLGGNFIRALTEIWPEPPAEVSKWEGHRDPFCPAPFPVPPDEVRVVGSG